MAKVNDNIANTIINSAMVNINTVGAAGHNRPAFFMPNAGDLVFQPDFTKDGKKWSQEAYNASLEEAKKRADAYRLVTDAMCGDFYPEGFTQAYLNQLGNNQLILEKTPPTNRGVNLPKKGISILPEMKACIAFDWISCTVKLKACFATKKREVVKVREGNKAGHYQIWYGMLKKAELTLMQGNNQENLATLKLENRECYQEGHKIIALIKLICDDMGMQFLHFTRLDTAIDIQTTKIKGMGVQDLFNKIGRGDLIFKAKRQHAKAELPNDAKDSIKGEEEQLVINETFRRQGKVNTVYVGSRKSGFQICMYNKSLQMRSQNFKPWVKQNWEAAGHVDGFDTYRIEFRHNKDVKELKWLDETTGEFISLGLALDNLDILNKLGLYVTALYNQHFVLAEYEEGVRFSRMTRIDILGEDFEVKGYKSIRYTEKKPSTNLIKNRLKHLAQHAQAAWAGGRKLNASECFKTCFAICEEHDLNSWFSSQMDRLKINDCIAQVNGWLAYTAIAIDTEQNRVLDYYQM